MVWSQPYLMMNGWNCWAATVFLIVLVVFRAPPVNAPLSEWDKTYGGTENDVAYSLIQTSDGGYALAGYTGSYGVGWTNFWLVKTDDSGRKEWSQTYGANTEIAYSLIQTSEGGYALAGLTTSYGAGSYDFWLVKTDSNGNALWNRTYGGKNTDVAHSVIQTSDSGYALAGYTNSHGFVYYDFLLVKTDSAGNMLWNKTYGGPKHDQATSVVETSDGGFVLAGSTQSYGAGNADFWLVKTDSLGNARWNRTYGGANNDYAFSVVQSVEGGYALTGHTNSFGAGMDDFWLVKTDSVGATQWCKTYGGPNPDKAFSLIETVNGGYALAGSTNSTGAGMDDLWVVKTDSSGNVQFNRTYGGANSDVARSVVQTNDSGFALAGYTDPSGAGSYDFWLVKLTAQTIHDVAVASVTLSKTIVGQGYSVIVSSIVENQGSVEETFTVRAYADTTIIQTRTVTLRSGGSTTINYTWNTTDVVYGNYVISVNAELVLGETETADNIYTGGTVLVTIPGDVNGDRIINVLDLSVLSKVYGSTPGKPNWNANADINNDVIINAQDLDVLSKNFGKMI